MLLGQIGHEGQGHGPVSLTDVTDDWPTWRQVVEVLTYQSGYNTSVVLASTTLLGIAAGIVGVFALLRKRSLMADALSHATLPGIGLAFIAATVLGIEGRSLPVLLMGAAATGVAGVLCVQWLLRHTRLKEDASIGLVLSIFFGAGTVLLSYIQTMGASNAGGIDAFIFGQTAAMSASDAGLMGVIAVVSVLFAIFLYKEFALVCFNDAFAKVDGWPVSWIDLAMMGLVVGVTVAGLQAVGLILVVAMLIIPAVAARFWTEKLWQLLILAAIIGGLSGYLGSATSALLPRKPAGAVIVLVSGVLFALSMFLAPRRGVLAAMLRRLRLQLDIATDHMLETAYLTASNAPSGLDAAALKRFKKQRGWNTMLTLMVGIHAGRHGYGRLRAHAFTPTPRGLERGQQVCRNHLLWEQYLISYADIAPNHLDWAVDQVEHVLSPSLVAELEAALAGRGVDSFLRSDDGGMPQNSAVAGEPR
ncbi:MAG: iron chelate uptake ABC transporter family permease subunit [Planctomycetota bacterium]